MTKHGKYMAVAIVVAAALAMTASARAAEPQGVPAEKERELIAVLRSDAPPGDKAIACKQLAVYGSSEAVPALSRLLVDEQLASWARISLEAIPGAAADEALRRALDSLQGKLLIGAINSIGVRRDLNAVEPLASRLHDRDAEVASAAATALGSIGNPAAAQALRRLLPSAPAAIRSAVAEGCVLCAERFLAQGNAAEAIAIYDEVRKADVPRQRILEATRGAIVARGNEGIALLLEQVRSSDKTMFQLALGTAREIPGKQVDEALAAELPRTAPDRAVRLLDAMADRKETVVLSAVQTAARRGPREVRVAAIDTLGRAGNVSCLTQLLETALETDADIAQAAKISLAGLSDAKVDSEILERLPKATGNMYPLLIELVGQRRIAALSELLKALEHRDKTVRVAALMSLGETVPANRLAVLIAQAVSPKHADDAAVAQKALKAACVRMPDRDACAGEVSMAMNGASASAKAPLLEILSAVGGTQALAAIGAAAKGADPQLQDAASRALGEWMTIDAAPVLLELATNGPAKYQVRALRGYLRIARQFVMPIPERVAMCQSAFAAARQPAEKKLVLEVLKRYPHLETLKLAVRTTRDVPDLRGDAADATLAIAAKLGGKSAEVRDVLSKAMFDKVKLEIVKAEYGAGDARKDVTEILRQKAADAPLILLAANYDSVFGGDRAPGAAKELRIQYRIDDKAGEATFAEDALIILASPK